MQIGEEYTVKTEKILNNGSALARINNLPVFIENACPLDIIKIKITGINKKYLKGEIIEFIEKSPYRMSPVCSLHNICGSCNWQYISYDEQLKQKEQIVKETINHIAGIDAEIQPIIPSPVQQEYRCKVQMPVSQTKVSKRILSGYYKKNSHELINIKYCPMQPEIINEINEFIKKEAQNINITGYSEKNNKGLLRHIVYRISSDLTNILIIFVINNERITPELKKLASVVSDKYSAVTGVCANFNTKKTNVILGENTSVITGNGYYIESLNNIKYKVSANSFFQVNPKCAALIFDKVKELISKKLDKPSILDAYSGVSSFGIWLSDIASKVVCIEEVKSASSDAKTNIELNNCKNIEIINGDAACEFKKLIANNIKFDVTIIDPPRKGSTEEALNAVTALTNKYIVYVSCNPSTLARDMKILAEKGFIPEYIQPADMFPHTYHVETIALFKQKKEA